MNDIISRSYRPDDYSACLAVFDSNVPTFFASDERDDFCEFLGCINAKDRPYLVLMREGSIIACGGLIIQPKTGQARLAWGMVDKVFHGQGLGTHLMEARLALARATPDIIALKLATSQHTHGFYEGFGFSATNVTADGFAPGLDRWDMTLRLV